MLTEPVDAGSHSAEVVPCAIAPPLESILYVHRA